MSEGNGQSPPQGWTVAPLAKISRINPSIDCGPISDDAEVNFVPMRALDAEGGGLVRPDRRLFREVKKGYTPFLSGDVIMAKITPCMENGKTTVVPSLPGRVCFGSTEFHVVRGEDGISPRWLSNFLLQYHVRRSAQRAMTGGVGQMRVPASFLENLNIPIAPTAEQDRICDALDELLSDLDAGVAALERTKAKLAQYREAVLKAAVEGALVSFSARLERQNLGTLIESVNQGWSPKCERQASVDSDVWCIIKTTAIQAMKFLPNENKVLPTGLSPRPQLQIVEGDLLMTRAGPRARAAVTCLVRSSRPRLMLCDKAYIIRCKKEKVCPAYLEVCFNAPQIIEALDTLKTGISDSGVNLTQARLLELIVPLPSPDDQLAVVEAVENQMSVVEHLQGDLDAKLKSTQSLRQSLLRHAFFGKLVPQDLDDEPATELLKRIAAEREKLARIAVAERNSIPSHGRRGNARRNRNEHR
ncbi:MAG TPA: hypothetical protein VMJ32_17035 [Pirellulales bacterium]|nr:hypothetical protein [Pirellulales bacterium]